MSKLFSILIVSLFATAAPAQSISELKEKIQQIISEKKATVGVSIVGEKESDTLSVNGEMHFPMQSVFKAHIALALLSEIDKGKFSLSQKINIEKKDMLPGLYSPIREKYPEGASLSIAEILRYTVSESDNAGCDALLRLLGGPQVVEKYFVKNYFRDLAIRINEETQQNNWELQFQNWTTPKAACAVLASYYYNRKKLLSKKSYRFFWQLMRKTETGPHRLKGELPAGTVVAHKTGTSGTNKEGISAAVNDIGVIFLPTGKHFFISIFVTASAENTAANEKIIADIGKAAWDYFRGNTKKA